MKILPKLRIGNFGPIKNINQIYINKYTFFLGDQGAGKSTCAKLIATFLWIEKSLIRGNINTNWLKQRSFKDTFLSYHRLESYLNNNSLLEYEGEAYKFIVTNNRVLATEKENHKYYLPQIMYIPAERNFISYVRSANELKISSPALQDFLTEFNKSKTNIFVENKKLPFGDISIEYDQLNDLINLEGDSYKVRLSESSSGLQSATPLYLVSSYLAHSIRNERNDIMNENERNRFINEISKLLNNHELTGEQKRLALSTITNKFNKSAFINIVEEPEQNLFPESQWKMVKRLIELNSLNKHNKLIVTTHSPYIIGQLGIAVLLNELKNKNRHNIYAHKDLLDNLDINSEFISIYQLDTKGNITTLEKESGVPSDNNYLNNWLKKGNELFDYALELDE